MTDVPHCLFVLGLVELNALLSLASMEYGMTLGMASLATALTSFKIVCTRFERMFAQ